LDTTLSEVFAVVGEQQVEIRLLTRQLEVQREANKVLARQVQHCNETHTSEGGTGSEDGAHSHQDEAPE